MAFYEASYAGDYNEEFSMFTPRAGEPDADFSYEAEDGEYEPGDVINMWGYYQGVLVVGPSPVIFVGYTDNGFLTSFTSGGSTSYTFVTDDTALPIDVFFPITTTGTYAVCFLAGTMIATPEGERPVEELAIGDLVLTAAGETRPIRWLGRQSLVRMFADPLRSYPVRITAGALDDNLPARDLFVSPEHALLVDGLLVQAAALVNGSTIVRVQRPDEKFTYVHIELEDHALVLAEGVPAETFVDNVTRRRFDNFAEFEALYGEPAAVAAEMDVPRVKAARQLPAALRARLEARADLLMGDRAA